MKSGLMFKPSPVTDQAEGLRAMASRNSTRVIPVLSNPGDPEQSPILAHLAVALHRQGKRVLIIDAGRSLLGSWFGIALRYELSHWLNSECEFQQILKVSTEGVWVMSAAMGLEEMQSSKIHRQKLSRAISSLPRFDVCIVIAPAPGLHQLFEHGMHDLWMITSMESRAPSSTYARIKGIEIQATKKSIHMIYAGVRDAEQCERRHSSLRETVERNSCVDVVFGGAVANDLLMRRANLAPNSGLAMTLEQIAISFSMRALPSWPWNDLGPMADQARKGSPRRAPIVEEV
jgi:flagellar biosynthesis protein FlhG